MGKDHAASEEQHHEAPLVPDEIIVIQKDENQASEEQEGHRLAIEHRHIHEKSRKSHVKQRGEEGGFSAGKLARQVKDHDRDPRADELEEEFIDVYEYIADDLIEKAKKYKTINYLVPGNPIVAEKTVNILLGKDC